VNGKPGDHPLTDILHHGLPAFNEEVDGLIKEINSPVRRWESELIPFLLLVLHGRVRELREAGKNREADTLLHNFARTLRGERDRLA
jgi:hypothetical protein